MTGLLSKEIQYVKNCIAEISAYVRNACIVNAENHKKIFEM